MNQAARQDLRPRIRSKGGQPSATSTAVSEPVINQSRPEAKPTSLPKVSTDFSSAKEKSEMAELQAYFQEGFKRFVALSEQNGHSPVSIATIVGISQEAERIATEAKKDVKVLYQAGVTLQNADLLISVNKQHKTSYSAAKVKARLGAERTLALLDNIPGATMKVAIEKGLVDIEEVKHLATVNTNLAVSVVDKASRRANEEKARALARQANRR